jgi:regulator of sigma E protease
MLLGVEALKGSPLSAKVRERAQMIGFSLLIALILVVTYNDVLQLIS